MNTANNFVILKKRPMNALNEPLDEALKETRRHRETGITPVVFCIHAFSSSSAQYVGLTQRLAPRFRVVATDLVGHGKSPAWTGKRPFTLADEAAPIEALLPDDGPVHLVGHSYGAAIALRIANAHRTRVLSIALYEPAIWGTLASLCPDDPATLEIEAVRDHTIRLIERGRLEAAAECFIDYWGGLGCWAAQPQARRLKLAATVRSLPGAWRATFFERWTAAALASLETPCLLISGTRSTAAARLATDLLRDTLPNATVVDLDGLGHQGPITHPERVNEVVNTFLL
jgi:pimeloyl-ACP methyl ester carboxylesterase